MQLILTDDWLCLKILISLIIYIIKQHHVFVDSEVWSGNQDTFLLSSKHFSDKQIVTVLSLSYTDPNLYFQIYNKNNKATLSSDIPNISNYR